MPRPRRLVVATRTHRYQFSPAMHGRAAASIQTVVLTFHNDGVLRLKAVEVHSGSCCGREQTPGDHRSERGGHTVDRVSPSGPLVAPLLQPCVRQSSVRRSCLCVSLGSRTGRVPGPATESLLPVVGRGAAVCRSPLPPPLGPSQT